MSRRALLVGINNFVRPSWRLRGCINDIIEIETLLQTYYGFNGDEIKVLQDQDASNEGIRAGLGWLLSDYSGGGGDVRLFHFSSHGTQVEDQNKDEWEGFDEVIVPYDHDWDAPFRDDDLWESFKDVPENVNFTFIADCCHSGSIQKAEPRVEFHPRFLYVPVDVELRIRELREQRDDDLKAYQAAQIAQMLPGVPPGQLADKLKEFLTQTEKQFIRDNFAIVPFERHILLAACEDRQTAADARIEGEWRGAMTWALAKSIREANGDLSYNELIARAAANLKNYDQRPQLECPAALGKLKFLAPMA